MITQANLQFPLLSNANGLSIFNKKKAPQTSKIQPRIVPVSPKAYKEITTLLNKGWELFIDVKNSEQTTSKKIENINKVQNTVARLLTKKMQEHNCASPQNVKNIHTWIEAMRAEARRLKSLEDYEQRLDTHHIPLSLREQLSQELLNDLLAILDSNLISNRKEEICKDLEAALTESGSSVVAASMIQSLKEEIFPKQFNYQSNPSATFYQQCLSYHFIFDSNANDGDCMFHGFAKHLQIPMLTVRQSLKKFVSENKKLLFSRAYEDGGYENDENDYLKHLSLCGEHATSSEGWGTLRDSAILSRIYQRPVHIYCYYMRDENNQATPIVLNKNWDGSPLPADAEPIYLLFDGSVHYDSLFAYS